MSGWILLTGVLIFGVASHPGAPPPSRPTGLAISTAWTAPLRLAKGKLLVAREQMIDPNFAESVVLLLEYGEEGAMGLIVNRPTEVSLSDVLEIDGAERLAEPIYIGGPVARGRMMLLLRAPTSPEEAQRVFEDVHFSASKTLLERMVSRPAAEERFRVYAGHAGWAAGQLDSEIERGGWHIMPGDPDLVFSKAPTAVWPELIRRTTTRWASLEDSPLSAPLGR